MSSALHRCPMQLVALLVEGVDRNVYLHAQALVFCVALLVEGVDRNAFWAKPILDGSRSPSSWRAWIEIYYGNPADVQSCVALLAEGVDRNNDIRPRLLDKAESPSSRRAWIEISARAGMREPGTRSPSSRRAWIEMPTRALTSTAFWSPSSRRAWIEMFFGIDAVKAA